MTVTRQRCWAGVVDDGGCERVGFGVVDADDPNTNDQFGHGWALDVLWWDSVPLNSRNSFLQGDSRNHSGRN